MTQRYLWKLLRFNQAYYPTIIYCNIYGCKHTRESFYHITSATCFKGIENKETTQPCINFLPVQFIKQHRGYASKWLKRKQTTELCIDIFKFQSSVPNQRRAKYRMICIKTLLRYHWPSTCWVFIMRTQENIMAFPPIIVRYWGTQIVDILLYARQRTCLSYVIYAWQLMSYWHKKYHNSKVIWNNIYSLNVVNIMYVDGIYSEVLQFAFTSYRLF